MMGFAGELARQDYASSEALIREYYRRIDAVDLDWVLALFAPDAVYERADATYEGSAAISKFFREDRQIRGEHEIDHIWCDGDSLVATGEFRGQGAAGDARNVRFADVWMFDAQ